jgi:hypothetical protein
MMTNMPNGLIKMSKPMAIKMSISHNLRFTFKDLMFQIKIWKNLKLCLVNTILFEFTGWRITKSK